MYSNIKNSDSYITNSGLGNKDEDLSNEGKAKLSVAVGFGCIGATIGFIAGESEIHAAYAGDRFPPTTVVDGNTTYHYDYIVVAPSAKMQFYLVGIPLTALSIGMGLSSVRAGFKTLKEEKDKKNEKIKELLGEEKFKKIEELV